MRTATGRRPGSRRPRLSALAVTALAALGAVVAPPLADARADEGVDCRGPAEVAAPGTPEWDRLNADNAFCARERDLDEPAHPLLADGPLADPYRDPARLDDVRVRYDTTTVGGLDTEVYRPCDAGSCPGAPDDLERFEAPYPAVVVFHGGGANRSLYRWATQSLAEAGYLVVAFDSPGGPTLDDASTVVDWLHGDDPLVADFDGERLGVAGHSRGGVVVSEFGQTDPRVDAVVSWDRAQSTSLPADLDLRTPSLFFFADYNCQQVPICNPEAYDAAPDPDGPGTKGDDYPLLVEAGVDTMQVPLRAALHLDWTPPTLAGNRYVESVSNYFTLAWFDRYVRGATEPEVAASGFERLTAEEFDDSADRHNISQGVFDPALADPADPYSGNVPYSIEGMPVADRLSFFFRAKCAITAPGTEQVVTSEDIRTDGCAAPAGSADPAPSGTATDTAADADDSSAVGPIAVVLAGVIALLAAGGLLLRRRRG